MTATKLDDQWISLLSGAHFNYNKPEESDVTIDDIASALSNVCRFSGNAQPEEAKELGCEPDLSSLKDGPYSSITAA